MSWVRSPLAAPYITILPPAVAAELKPLADQHEKYVLFPDQELDFEHLAKTYTSRYIRPALGSSRRVVMMESANAVEHRLNITTISTALFMGLPAMSALS